LAIKARLFGATLFSALALGISFAPLTSTPGGPQYLPTTLSSPAPQAQSSLLNPQSSAHAAPLSTNSSGSVYYRQTGHSIKDTFLNYWLMNGGVELYGYPITEELNESGVPVQYFERARFEYRPTSTRPWKVELTQLGRTITEGRDFPRVDSTSADRTLYSATGHSLGGAFRTYWSNKGGLAIFGYPISEELQENGKTVQYFERARMELVSGKVQLAHIGREALQKQTAQGLAPDMSNAASRPGFQMSFRGEATVFSANWERVISLNKGWGNLPQNYVGRGLYAAAPADLGLYGRWARVTKGTRSVYVQFIDVINWPDIPYVRSRGIVIDLGQESFDRLAQYRGGRYEVSFDVFWPEDEP
jgi:hypothetical protein